MKFQAALSLLTLSGAALVQADASILERQVATIVGVVNQIDSATQALDTAVKGFSGDASALTSASQKLQDTVTQGVSTVNGASSITMEESLQIQGQVSNLQSTVTNVVNDLIAKKDAIVSAGQGGAVEESLNKQLEGAKALQGAISSKVPPALQQVAVTLSAGINDALQKGIDAFKGTGSGSGSGSDSTTPSTGSSSDSGATFDSDTASGSLTPSGSSADSSASGSSHSGASSGSSSHGAVTTSSAPKPAQYTAAAAPRAVAGSLAGAVAVGAIIFAL